MFNVADHLFLLCMFLLHCLFAEKVLSELMQPISDRLDSVRQFTSDIQPSLQYNIVPITDPFGPAVTDSQLDCIVVTTETVLGADRINVKRVEQVWYYHQKTHILCITHCWSLKYIRVSCLFRNVWTDSLPALSAN